MEKGYEILIILIIILLGFSIIYLYNSQDINLGFSKNLSEKFCDVECEAQLFNNNSKSEIIEELQMNIQTQMQIIEQLN